MKKDDRIAAVGLIANSTVTDIIKPLLAKTASVEDIAAMEQLVLGMADELQESVGFCLEIHKQLVEARTHLQAMGN